MTILEFIVVCVAACLGGYAFGTALAWLYNL
jgi:hypothetical protein